jgi:hypothetical protein
MKLFFKNYKAIFHLIGILMTFGIFFLAGFKDEMKDPLFNIFVLAVAYFVSKYGLRKSGIDEEAEKYFKEQAQKKGDN